MQCPSLNELPSCQTNNKGWPWNKNSPRLFGTMSDGYVWPRMSVVTPSYNQGEFIEETIRSVLLQGYPDVEYIIIDGGSQDGSLKIIKKYEKWLKYWESKPDRGQAHAINKGWTRATGSIYLWLNSDDLLAPGSLICVAKEFYKHNAQWLCGGSLVIDETGRERQIMMPLYHKSLENMLTTWEQSSYSYPQMSTYVSANVVHSAGLLREDLNYVFDHEYWVRLVSLGYNPCLQNIILSRYRLHPKSKTVVDGPQFTKEAVQVAHEYANRFNLKTKAVRLSLARGHAIRLIDKLRQQSYAVSRWKLTFDLLKTFIIWPSLMIKRPTLELFLRLLKDYP